MLSLLNDDKIDISNVFWVDIGSFHPMMYSNTYLFYKAGACGINIDCRPGSKKLFDKIRKRDINLEIALGEKKDKLFYYTYKYMTPCNTFDKKLVEKREYKPYKVYQIETQNINDVFEKYIPINKKITFLDIDVENKEYDILKNFDFSKYRPKYILCEILDVADKQNDLLTLLNNNSYFEISRCVCTRIFKYIDKK